LNSEYIYMHVRSMKMGSDRSLTADEEAGCSDALAATNHEIVEFTRFSGYFSRENNHFSRSHSSEK